MVKIRPEGCRAFAVKLREPVIVPVLEPVIVPVLEPVIVPVLEPVIVPVLEPVIVPVRAPLVLDPVMVPPSNYQGKAEYSSGKDSSKLRHVDSPGE